MVSWFKQQFGHPEIAAAFDEGVPPEALFDRMHMREVTIAYGMTESA